MWYRREQVILQPLAIGEHAFLMAARTEVASFAGPGQQVFMAALIAVDAREPLMQVTAVEKAFEDPRSLPTGGPGRPYRVHRCVVVHTGTGD